MSKRSCNARGSRLDLLRGPACGLTLLALLTIAALCLPLLAGCQQVLEDIFGPGTPEPPEELGVVAGEIVFAEPQLDDIDGPVAWSPDETLLVLEADGNIVAANRATGGLTLLSNGFRPGSLGNPWFFPDGRLGVLGDLGLFGFDLFVATIVGDRITALTPVGLFDGVDVRELDIPAGPPELVSVAAAGKRAVACWGRQAFTFDRTSGQLVVTPLLDARGRPATRPVISPFGDQLAYVNSISQVALRDFAGGPEMELGRGAVPSFSGNGRFLGFVDTRFGVGEVFGGLGDIFGGAYDRVDLLAEEVLRFGLPLDFAGGYPSLSFSGDQVAFESRTAAGLGIATGELLPAAQPPPAQAE